MYHAKKQSYYKQKSPKHVLPLQTEIVKNVFNSGTLYLQWLNFLLFTYNDLSFYSFLKRAILVQHV